MFNYLFYSQLVLDLLLMNLLEYSLYFLARHYIWVRQLLSLKVLLKLNYNLFQLDCMYPRRKGSPEWTWTGWFRQYLTGNANDC